MAPIVRLFRYELRLWRDGACRVVSGVDGGRGRPDLRGGRRGGRHRTSNCHPDPGCQDSRPCRQLGAERLAPLIRARAVAVGVGAASVREIDQLNIYHATHLAMRRAIARVGDHDHVLVDGNRIAGDGGARQAMFERGRAVARVYSIACASVVAKVVRDRMVAHLPGRSLHRAMAGSATRATPRSSIAGRSGGSG